MAEQKAVARKSTSPTADEVARDFQRLGLGDLVRKRAMPGKIGKTCVLRSNHFGLVWKTPAIFRYVVSFDPEISAQEQVARRIAVGKFRNDLTPAFGVFVFDGTCILSPTRVDENLQFQLKDGSANITITPSQSHDTSDVQQLVSQEVNMIINIVLKKSLRMVQLRQIGRNYFTDKTTQIPDFDIQLYKGYSVACEPTVMGLSVVIDTVSRVVRMRTVRHVMDEIEKEVYEKFSHLSQEDQYKKIEDRVHQELSGQAVLTSHTRTLYRVDFVDWTKTGASTFDMKGTPVSFAQYFKDRYNVSVPSDRYGVLVSIPKNQKSETDLVYLMPEVCHLTGLTDKMRGNYRLMKAIADETKLAPGRRLQQIEGLARSMNDHPEMKNENYPFSMKSDASKLQGRVIGPFHVITKDATTKDQVMQTANNFGNQFRNMAMKQPVRIQSWLICAEKRDSRMIGDFVRDFQTCAKRYGMMGLINPPQKEEIDLKNAGRGLSVEKAWEQLLGEAIERHKPIIVVCLIPDKPAAIYSSVKRVCCVTHPVASQVVLVKNMLNDKKRVPVVGNVLKQMMTKLGATPWIIGISAPNNTIPLNTPTMIVGVDVCHDRKLGRSVVGFAATYSRDFGQYNSYIAFQRIGEEIVSTASELMAAAIRDFGKTAPLPQNIIVYRDGVANSQFDTLVKQEIQGFKNAFKEVAMQFNQQYAPKLAVIVVQKRVSARFFVDEGKQLNSPTPCTVIDNGVVSPNFNDFYLVPCEAHPSQGTATPTRLVVVWDELKMDSDDIQHISAQLCMMYYNWPGPVRVPAPCQYAHKIAFLIGKHIPKDSPSAALNGKLFYL